MAQGGHSSGLDEEESEDVEDLILLPFIHPFIAQWKRQGDEKFRAKVYQEAALLYSMALNFPISTVIDISIISEKLFRQRAVCFFKLGKYLDAIHDSDRAIEIADYKNSRNLAKSIFIKMNAIMCLEDFVPALPLAVWCKHLRPNCETTKAALNDLKEKLREEFKKDDSLVDAVLLIMIQFASQMGMENETRELALECYTELLELLDFMLLPGVLFRQAECLMNLGRCNEAKDVCANVLWLNRDDLEALELMSEITKRLKERELKTASKETKKANTATKESPEVEIKAATATSTQDCQPFFCEVDSQAVSTEKPEENKPNDDLILNSEHKIGELEVLQVELQEESFSIENTVENNPTDDVILNAEEKQKQYTQEKEENPLSADAINVEEKVVELDQTQVEDAAAKDHVAKVEKKRKKNKQKKKPKKKAKKKCPQKKDTSSDQAPMSDKMKLSPEESPDEDDSQATDSVIGDPDITDCINTEKEENVSFSTLPSTFSPFEVNKYDDSDNEGFVTVQNTRRPFPTKAIPSKITPAVQNKFGERVSCLDGIGASCGKLQLSDQAVNIKPNSETSVEELLHPFAKQSPLCSTATIVEKPHPGANVTASHGQLKSETNTVPQLQGMSPTDATGMRSNTTQSKVPSSLNLDEFPSLEGKTGKRPTHNSMNPSSTAWSNFKAPEVSLPNANIYQSEVLTQEPTPQQLLNMSSQRISGQTSSSTGFTSSTRPGHPEMSPTPVALSQSFQTNVTGPSGARKIPEGVLVVCDHFLQDNRRRPAENKTCKLCENRGMLKYAAWNNNRYYWQVMRPYPVYGVPPNVVLDVCRHFSWDRPCPKEPCTFPHGEQETNMWTLERKGLLPTPQESLKISRSSPAAASSMIQPIVQDKDSSSMPLHTAETRRERGGAFVASFELDEFPGLGAVSSQSSTTDTSRNTSTAWSTPHKASQRPSTPVLPSAKPTTTTMTSQVSHMGAVSSQSSTADSSKSTLSSAWSTRLEASPRLPTPVLPSAKPAILTSQIPQSAAPSMKTGAVMPVSSSNTFRKIPKGVFVVCDDFLQKNLKRGASIYEKSKACKGCEIRSKLKYAVWCDNSKQWQLIRPYPAEKVPANVAFSECGLYSTNRPCRWTSCTFAHGQQELIMWTMEREGILPTPRETLTGSSGSMTQPSAQLRYRPSPPGVTNGSYRFCKSCYTRERCRFGRGCIFAHGIEELNEWIQEYDRKKNEKLRKEISEKKEVCSLEMVSSILKGPAEDLVEHLPGVEVSCTPPELNVKLQDKNDSHKCQWTFTLVFKTNEVGHLRHVLLLHRYHNCYQLSEIRVGCYQDTRGYDSYTLCYTAKLKDSWYKSPATNISGRMKVSLTVSFESPLYGSFDQWVIFDFGKKPFLVQKLNADVMSESLSQTPIVPEHATESASAVIWDESSMEVVRFVHETKEGLEAEHLSRSYSLPKQVNITAESLNPGIYKRIMHKLLFVEEGFMKDEISRYTLNKTQLHAQWNIFDDMTGMQCAVDGELFGVLHLQEENALRPDDAAGRLLYRNVSSVWLQLTDSVSSKVYEAPVEKVESECVVVRLSSKMCSDLNLYDTCDAAVNAQFQLNRWPLCQMHSAVDRLTAGQLRLIFPQPRVGTVMSEIKIRWQWLLDDRLNANQKKVIERIACPEYNAPPLVVFGPFGTGKTFTLYQAVRLLVQLDKSHRILLCTYSNRAADIHVELLHDYLTKQNGIPAARPLRIYQPMRRLETASKTARNYCLIKNDVFVLPSRDDIVEHRVVVTTLSTSQVLLDLQVSHGFFTHILIDEAAQALEPEALTPLIFAGPNTKVVFTGDHMQMSPEVYSPQARRLGLQKSLAERLFDLYDKHEAGASNVNPNEESNVLFLTENYRCHQDILQFPSDNFYGEKLVARAHASQPAHPKYGPLLFFSARGKEKKGHDNSYINLSEVYEVVKRVKEIADSWPAIWGPKKLSDIAVLSAYRYQVQAIRNSLRKDKDLKDVKVDTIHYVQGEEFRVLFISTVRTFHTCKPQQEELRASGSDRQLYWEFLSDPKLLNTAVTRARCLVAVVGDPVSLCTVGECRSIWRDYIKRCNDKKGLHGTTVDELDKEVNASIASIELNPKAQSFIPNFLPTQDKSSSVDVNEEKEAEGDKEAVEETKLEKNADEAQPSESHGKESNNPPKMSGEVTESSDQEDVPCVNTMALQYQEDDDVVDEIAESGDFQDNLLEDESVFPRDMDEIILAFVKKCEETLQNDAQLTAMFEDSEFPTLQAAKEIKHGGRNIETAEEGQHVSFKGGADIKDLFPEVRVVNGRVEVHLTNIGFYNSPSERAKRIMVSSKQQEFLDPSVLMKLVEDEPQKYIVCNLRLSPEKSQVGYAEIEDTKTPAIHIRGRVRRAFDKDKVVVEMSEKKARPKVDGSEPLVQGRVVGVLEHIIGPHERQFVCTTDYNNPALMVPINKSATKLVNLTDKSCKDIPIYKKDHNERATKVKMMKREKVLSGKYMFVVKYLQWRKDFSYPLGIVVRTLSRGDDFKSSMEIAYAEHAIRRVFKEETVKYVKEKFPPEWSIPETERNNRTRVIGAITIDPPTSLDLDDALTIEGTSPSTFVVGIHIADVSFFVKPNTPLDEEAFLRCTSYYPGKEQENIPMLPRELSENFCSLLPNEDRLAVSVFFTLDDEGRITARSSIKRTIVRSCCRLTYAEAQMVIHGNDSSTAHIPEEIMEKIRQLSSLAQKRRFLRLGDRSFDHWQDNESGEYFEAHELVEEMMILSNEEIAKCLSQKSSELAPLRIQLPPKDHRLAEWIEVHGKYAHFSLKFSSLFNNETTDTSPLNVLHDKRTMFKIQRSVWRAMYQAVESRDLERLHHLICNENNHPQIAAAISHFRRIQSESRYVCEGDQPPENIFHYSLGMRCYTHFTSPIRRYVDIVVHRLLLGLQSGSCYSENLPKDDITKVCRRSTFMYGNARKFGKDCKRIHMATQLQQQCRETRVFIESMDHQSISLHITNQEDDHLASKQKRMLLSHLNPVALTEEDENGSRERSIVLKWKFRKYVAPDAKSNITEASGTKLAGYSGIGEVAEIPSDIWLRVLDAVRAKDGDKLTTIIKQTEAKLGIMSSTQSSEKPAQNTSPGHVRGVPYKHPHQNNEAAPSSEETVDHFYEKSLTLRKYDFFSLQLCPHMTRGILQPDIQMFKIDAHLTICIEHRRYPRESFAHTARHQASREHYGTIDEYIKAWKPVLAMEAATEAVKENDGFVIENLNVAWEHEDDNVSGLFTLPSSYCASRQLDFYLGDLACVRVPYCDTDSICGETSKQAKPSPDYPCYDENRPTSDVWVAHCIIKKVVHIKEIRKVEVSMELHQTSSNIPEGLTNWNSHGCTVELIHRTLPQRRMYAALCSNLKDASELVHAICKGEEPKKENYGAELPPSLCLLQHGFQKLNQYQEIAVKEALSEPFTLIQGPPGTGKTITGVHIAYWFAERNKKLKSYKVVEKDTGETECAGAYKAPPQVIYCGPSNKSVDVVTEYLLRIPDLKVLRVYSDQVEQKEFPIPNKLKPARATRSDQELKISSDKIRSVSLHHVIRGPECPYSQELRQFEEGFTHDKAKGEIISRKEVEEYRKVIGLAEKWVLQESGVQIVLCTCATSGSPRITTSCDNFQQCIVDECGMCMEPESLVPITCSGARQVVLIGDHKQLQPVIQDHVAKTLGLSVSMFERLSERAKMLELQYRMHVGICEFPSKQFYDEKLQTAETVKSRDPSPVSFWPALVRRQRNLPIVFCHVEGQEESSAITTSESNEESKRNMKEVRKAVQVAKYIVNRYRPQVRMSDLVILSPYREQRSKITELLTGAYADIQVTTITKSQGSEWDYVIISLVRSLKRDDIDPEPSLSWLRDHLGFVTDEHQMNVGLTRARRGLCIIGNKHLLGMDPMWKCLLQHYEDNHCLVDEAWPWQ